MDAVTGCQEKLVYFTVKDLQIVLAQTGLPRSGKKKELTDRILAVLGKNKDTTPIRKEEVVRCIDSVFRKIQQRKIQLTFRREVAPPGMAQLTKPVQKKDGYRFRCICGSSIPVDPIILCEDSRCRTWQHAGCAIVLDPVDQQFHIPTRFLCDICRIQRADPYWVTVAYPLFPVKLVPSHVASDCLSPALCVEKTFVLSELHMQLLRCNEYELQAWSLLMNDKVQFRMHWPLDSNFYINGTKLGVLSRPPSQLLGTNSRDDGPLIKAYCKERSNNITLAWNDTRTFCFGIRIVKRRTIDQVLNMIDSNNENGETLEDALARVRRCIGGNGTKSDSTDSDLEIVDDCVTINLRCPISGSRIKVAARFKPCVHMGCFDLHTFVDLNQHARKWQCPICLKNYSLEDLIIDPYFAKITSMLSEFDGELTEIEVNVDGSWRLKGKDGLNGSGFPWHSPNGFVSDPNTNPNLEYNQVESEDKLYKCEENVSGAHLGENPNILNEPGSFSWFQPDPEFYPNLISPPCGDEGNASTPGGDLRCMEGGGIVQCQEDWIALCLAAGIVHPVPDPVNDNLSAMSGFGLPPNSGVLLPTNATSNQPSIPNLEMLMNYNIFSPQVTPEFFHITDPNFLL